MDLTRTLVGLGLATRSETPAEPVATKPTPEAIKPPSRDGLPVTPERAVTLDGIYRALFILETSVMQLEVDVIKNGSAIDAAKVPSVITSPDVWQHRGGWLAETVASLACRGNAFWFKRRGPKGDVLNLEVLNPLEVSVTEDKSGRPVYGWRGKSYSRADIAHLKLLRMPGRLDGLGPIQAAAARIGGFLDVADYGSEWFNRGGQPAGLLSTEQHLTPEQAKAWKSQWADNTTNGETAVLGAGLTYAPLALKPSEVQWLESQKFSTTAIARLFGIPSRRMLTAVEGSSTTYANAEQEDIEFVRYTLMLYLREIELALSDVLPRGSTVRFRLDGLLRTDTGTRYAAYATALAAGFLTVNEVRSDEGRAPLATPAPQPQEAPA